VRDALGGRPRFYPSLPLSTYVGHTFMLMLAVVCIFGCMIMHALMGDGEGRRTGAQLWRREGLDFRLKPYLCLSTGDEVGMIEVVLNAETVSNIQQAYGGSTAAFRDTPLDEWIRTHNKDRTYLQGWHAQIEGGNRGYAPCVGSDCWHERTGC
jgi:hypothetical protein